MSSEQPDDDITPAGIVGLLADVYNRQLTPLGARGYLIALSDLGPGQLAAARDRALKTCKFMPTPAELRDLAGANGPQYPALVSRAK